MSTSADEETKIGFMSREYPLGFVSRECGVPGIAPGQTRPGNDSRNNCNDTAKEGRLQGQ